MSSTRRTSKRCAEATVATVTVPSPVKRGKKRAAPDIKEEDSVIVKQEVIDIDEPSTSTGIVRKHRAKAKKVDYCDEESGDEQDNKIEIRKENVKSGGKEKKATAGKSTNKKSIKVKKEKENKEPPKNRSGKCFLLVIIC